jgi:lysophospholipase L1-like esterase
VLTPARPRRRLYPRFRRSLVVIATTLVAFTAAFTSTAAASSSVTYVALGDSYSSGVGAGNYIASSGSCDRSPNAYSALWAAAHAPSSYVSVACSGATTSDVISSQVSALGAGTTLVSITIGGNDVGFASVMETCVLDSTSSCLTAVANAESQVATVLPGKLNSTLATIRSHAPSAHVVVLDYPELYDLNNSWWCIGLSTSDRTALNQAADRLDAAIQTAATVAGDTFADVKSRFQGHELCDGNDWLHSVNITDISESYHPTAAGQSGAYLPAFSAVAP